MDYVNVYVEKDSMTYQVDKGTTFLELSKRFSKDFTNDILLVKQDNELMELNEPITKNCSVEFLDISDQNGFRLYQRSLAFLMTVAVKELFGEKTRVMVEHSINKNYYCELPEIELSAETVKSIELKMREIVKLDYPIEKRTVSIESGMALFRRFGMEDTANALKFQRNSSISLYKLNWFYDYLYGPMVSSTGLLKKFNLVKTDDGFLIQFPDRSDPSKYCEVKYLKKLTKVYKESSSWARILKVHTVGSLNDAICSGNIRDIILISEALQEKKIAQIADMITMQNKNIVLIAGPSSSGKTTFANRICVQLKVNGLKPYVLSLDDYYLDRGSTPLGEDGKPNFEILEALDIKQFNEDMLNLIDGKTIQIPHYNFRTGKREYKGNFIKLGAKEVLIIEGIHGLNERLTQSIPKENKFKVYISALTQLNIDEHNRIPTTDARLIRRLVRDNNFRGFGAVSTLDMWPAVNQGERENIFPYQEEADAMFNSALVYELCVLKPFVEPLLFNIDHNMPQFIEANRLLNFIGSFLSVNCADIIPPNSIIREFIGGSCFNV